MSSSFFEVGRRATVLGMLLVASVLACTNSGDQTANATQGGVRAAPGDTVEPDGRTPIDVSAGTRFAVLTEMRTMLRAVQGVVASASAFDTAGVRTAALTAGMAAASEADLQVQRELGSEFVMLGMRTHMQFDSLATDVSRAKDQGVVLRRMAAIMGNCVGCHEQYRLVVQH